MIRSIGVLIGLSLLVLTTTAQNSRQLTRKDDKDYTIKVDVNLVTLEEVSRRSEAEVAAINGVGPRTLERLRAV